MKVYQYIPKYILILLFIFCIYSLTDPLPTYAAKTGLSVNPMIQTINANSPSPTATLTLKNIGNRPLSLSLKIVPIQQKEDGSAKLDITINENNSLNFFYNQLNNQLEQKKLTTIQLPPHYIRIISLDLPSNIDKDYYFSLLLLSKDINQSIQTSPDSINVRVNQEIAVSPFILVYTNLTSQSDKTLIQTILKTDQLLLNNPLKIIILERNNSHSLEALIEKVTVKNSLGITIKQIYLPTHYIFASRTRSIQIRLDLPIWAIGTDTVELTSYDHIHKTWKTLHASIIFLPLTFITILLVLIILISLLCSMIIRELRERLI